MTAESGKFDEIPPRCFQKLPLPAEPMNSMLAVLVTLLAKSDHKHFVLRDPLSVEVDNVMVMLCRSAANAVRVVKRDPVTIAALRSVHLERYVIV
jgi:hypothetical protein